MRWRGGREGSEAPGGELPDPGHEEGEVSEQRVCPFLQGASAKPGALCESRTTCAPPLSNLLFHHISVSGRPLCGQFLERERANPRPRCPGPKDSTLGRAPLPCFPSVQPQNPFCELYCTSRVLFSASSSSSSSTSPKSSHNFPKYYLVNTRRATSSHTEIENSVL